MKISDGDFHSCQMNFRINNKNAVSENNLLSRRFLFMRIKKFYTNAETAAKNASTSAISGKVAI